MCTRTVDIQFSSLKGLYTTLYQFNISPIKASLVANSLENLKPTTSKIINMLHPDKRGALQVERR